MAIFNHLLFVIIILLFIKPITSYACTSQKVLEARSALSHPVSPEFQPQDLTTNQLCLVEAFFLRYARDPIDDLQGVLGIILRWDNVSDPQAQLVQSLIETASPSNDIYEFAMIQSMMHQQESRFRYDGSQRPPRLIVKRRYLYFSPQQVDLAQSVIETAGPSNDIHEAIMIYNILSGYRDVTYWSQEPWKEWRRPFYFSPEKKDLIDFILETAADDNHYRDATVIYTLLERDLNEQDLRNVKLALLTTGRDWANGGFSRFRKYSGFGRTSVVRAITDPSTSRQRKDLMALVAALEHPENEIVEGRLLRRIANTRYGHTSQEEYQCAVNALHAYMSPGQEGKPPHIIDNLWRMLSNGTCLGDPHFDRSHFINYDLETTLNEALLTLEAGENVNLPHQCVDESCL